MNQEASYPASLPALSSRAKQTVEQWAGFWKLMVHALLPRLKMDWNVVYLKHSTPPHRKKDQNTEAAVGDSGNFLEGVYHAVWQRIHRWGPTEHQEPRSGLNSETMKVKLESIQILSKAFRNTHKAPPHSGAFVTSPPLHLFFPHTSLPALTLLPSLSHCLFACAAEWKYAQMRKGAVKLHISTGGGSSSSSSSSFDPGSLDKETDQTIILDNYSGHKQKHEPGAHLFETGPCLLERPRRQGARVQRQMRTSGVPAGMHGMDARLFFTFFHELMLLVCGDPEIAAASLEVV
ncbi:hypothetical protein Q5P01_007422 [Channa striata]|uniref:Uncharacterized protein n=1 Tax=Channa striata TaxID=64152 RepID=A0AA88NC39_CHASR|nr:hypothetical protein Q5P01_007422 [Channa striata]